MHHREIIINNVKREKGMADFLGHSNDLIILSLSLSGTQVPTYNSISFMYRPRGRVNIRLSLQSCKEGRIVF